MHCSWQVLRSAFVSSQPSSTLNQIFCSYMYSVMPNFETNATQSLIYYREIRYQLNHNYADSSYVLIIFEQCKALEVLPNDIQKTITSNYRFLTES